VSRRTRKSIKASCDRLWSQVVKTRAGGVCERCGRSPEDRRGFHAHHVDGRNNHRLRFEVRNGWASCAACHRWAHDHPLLFAAWFQEHRPEDAEWVVHAEQREPIHRSLTDYLDLETELSELLGGAT